VFKLRRHEHRSSPDRLAYSVSPFEGVAEKPDGTLVWHGRTPACPFAVHRLEVLCADGDLASSRLDSGITHFVRVSVVVDVANGLQQHGYELFAGQYNLARIPGLSAQQVARRIAQDLALHILLFEDMQKLLKPGPTSARDRCHWAIALYDSYKATLKTQLKILKVPFRIYKENPDAVIRMHRDGQG
jgi:hypothetical protein